MFLRDAKQAEVMLSQQENYLTKDEVPNSLEQAENMLKRHQVRRVWFSVYEIISRILS